MAAWLILQRGWLVDGLQVVDGAILVLVAPVVRENVLEGPAVCQEGNSLHFEQGLPKGNLKVCAFL